MHVDGVTENEVEKDIAEEVGRGMPEQGCHNEDKSEEKVLGDCLTQNEPVGEA